MAAYHQQSTGDFTPGAQELNFYLSACMNPFTESGNMCQAIGLHQGHD